MRPCVAQWVRGGLRHARPTLSGTYANIMGTSAGLVPQTAGQGVPVENCTYIQTNAYAGLAQLADDETDHQFRGGKDPLRRSSSTEQARLEPTLSLGPQQTTDVLQRHRRKALPTAEEVRRALKGSSGSQCAPISGSSSQQNLQQSQQEPQPESSTPQLSWRDVVKAFRTSDHQASRPVLTDSYE